MAVTILEVQQNTEEWNRAHDDRVSGSSADILLTRGLDEALKQDFGNFRGNFYTQRGHILEGEAIEVYEAIYKCVVKLVGFVLNTKYPNAGCSPDGIDDIWLLEVKCFGIKKHLAIRKQGDIPFKIMAQLQFNMMITGLKKARLVLYNPDLAKKMIVVGDTLMPNPDYAPDKAFHVIEVRANPQTQRNMAAKLAKR